MFALLRLGEESPFLVKYEPIPVRVYMFQCLSGVGTCILVHPTRHSICFTYTFVYECLRILSCFQYLVD